MPEPRVGLFGGTFDPPHVGHLVAATEVREALSLDAVRLVVANDPWQKSAGRRVTPAGTRLRLAAAAVGRAGAGSVAATPTGGLDVSDAEVRLGGETTTARTLDHLRRSEPGVEFVVVLGADAAARVGTWRDAGACLRGVPVVVVDRPGMTAVELPDVIDRPHRVEVTQLDISSTVIRQRVAAGRSIRYLVPDGVADLIGRERLYRRPS